MLRSILSIVAGFICWYIAVVIMWVAFGYGPGDMPSDGFLLFSILPEAIFAVGCGYLTALIARKKEVLHSIILGGVFVVYGIISLVLNNSEGYQYPIWVPLSTIFILAPCIVLGGWLRKKRIHQL
jgi:integral membrane sensor domain MASE1